MTVSSSVSTITIKAVVQRGYGSPDVLRVEDVEMPVPTDGQVLVRVRAASVNAMDYHRVRAAMFVVRATSGLRTPREPRLGADAAGVVEAVGSAVTHVKPGDEVFGIRTGAFAEYVAGRTFEPKPRNLTFEQAAALPVAGITALQALRDHGGITAGQRVLVNGAGGGVGTFAVQLAKAFGADVTAVTRTEHLDLVRSTGADDAIDYTRDDFTRMGRRWDLVVEVAGKPSLGACRRALTPGGTVVVVGAGKGPGGPLARAASALVRSRALRQRVAVFIAKPNREDLLTLKELAEAGKLTPVIDQAYRLDQIADAVRHAERGARGKVVITV